MTRASSMHEEGHSKMQLWDNPEGWGGERGGREVKHGKTYVHPWRVMSMYGENHHNIVKKLSSNYN